MRYSLVTAAVLREFTASYKKLIVASRATSSTDQCVLVAWEEEPGMFCWDLQILGPPGPEFPRASNFALLQSYHAQGSAPNRLLILTEIQKERTRLSEPFKSSKAIDGCLGQFKDTLVELGHAT